VPTNSYHPEQFDQQSVYAHVNAAQSAVSQNDWDTVFKEASQAKATARSVYLYSVVSNSILPEIPAVMAVIDSLVFQAQATADLSILRDAKRLIDRATYTTHNLMLLRDDRKKAMLEGLQDRFEIVNKFQAAILESKSTSELDPNTPPAETRAKLLLESVAELCELGKYEPALKAGEMAVDDLLSILAAINANGSGQHRQFDVRLTEKLKEAGADSQEEQMALARRITTMYVLGQIPEALRALYLVQLAIGEKGRALQTSKLLAEIEKELYTPERAGPGEIRLSGDSRRRLAAALLNLAEAHFGVEIDQDFESAEKALNEAERILDELNEGAVLRTKQRYLRAGVTVSRRRAQEELVSKETVLEEVVKSIVSQETLQMLATWALVEESPVPGEARNEISLPTEVLENGPAAIIKYGIELAPDSAAARFWQATIQGGDPSAAQDQINQWLNSLDWRHGWAVAALRALDLTSPVSLPGLFYGIEFSRAILIQPITLTHYYLERTQNKSQSSDTFFGNESLTSEESPFGDPTVREVLIALDTIVAALEMYPSRLKDVLADMQFSSHQYALFVRAQLLEHPGQVFKQTLVNQGVGSAIGTLLRAASEQAEKEQDYDRVGEINHTLIKIVARYGFTSDFLQAVCRASATTARVNLPQISRHTEEQNMIKGNRRCVYAKKV
jgi:hypothetical protein